MTTYELLFKLTEGLWHTNLTAKQTSWLFGNEDSSVIRSKNQIVITEESRPGLIFSVTRWPNGCSFVVESGEYRPESRCSFRDLDMF